MAVKIDFQSHLLGTFEDPASYSQLQLNVRSTIGGVDLSTNLVFICVARRIALISNGESGQLLNLGKAHVGVVRFKLRAG
jgi:hypothetical protein